MSPSQGRLGGQAAEGCNLPLTGAGVVDMVITDLGVFTIDKNGGGMTLIELADGVTLDEIKANDQHLNDCALRTLT
jgi:acyl CoA:acetate/3-ketoacid CoA transferase beta subunit